METVENIFIALIVVAIVAVIVATGQSQSLISTGGQFLANMVQKIQSA
jgi:hypothetical protein